MSIHGPHSAVSSPEQQPTPSWRVISLSDPGGTGSDLAFTQGLAGFELPELLLWGRPSEGSDPGADWALTPRERTRLLNRWASDLVNEQLESGAQREERFDGGHTVARFRFGRARSPSYLDHPYLPPNTRMIAIAWSLRRRTARPTDQPAATLSPAVERRMRAWIASAEATTLAWRLRPDAIEDLVLEEPLSAWQPAQLAGLSIGAPSESRFGPMTPWVDARIAQVLAAEADVVAGYLARLHVAGHVRCEDCLFEQLERLATQSHRNTFCREAAQAAQEVAFALAGWPGSPTTLWAQAVTEAFLPLLPEQVAAADESMRVRLTDGLETLLRTAVLADLAPPSLIASGSGPWEWAVNEQRLPGRPWLAAVKARRAASQSLARATPEQLITAVEQNRFADLTERHAVGQLTTGLQTIAAASPPGSLFRRDQCRGLPPSIVRSADELAGQLVTAMALPHRVPPLVWDLIRHALSPLAPVLPAQLPKETP